MFDEDIKPKTSDIFTPANLDTMSVDELNAYIALMKEEISRVESDIKSKKAHVDAAASVFK